MSRTVWKGRRKGQAPDLHAVKVATLPKTFLGICGCFKYFGGRGEAYGAYTND